MTEAHKIAAVILAGGESVRFGREKRKVTLKGHTLLERAIERLASQADVVAISVAQSGDRDIPPAIEAISDIEGPSLGPLAGLHASLAWAGRPENGCRWLVTSTVDTPFIPKDFVRRLLESAEEAGTPGAVAASDGRRHPLHGIWATDLAARLQTAIVEEEMRSAKAWVDSLDLPMTSWDASGFDPFFNINREADLVAAEDALERNLVD